MREGGKSRIARLFPPSGGSPLGSVYTGPTEYLVGRIFGHLGIAFARGRLIDLKLGHLGVQIFGRLGKRPSLELERPSSRTAKYLHGTTKRV